MRGLRSLCVVAALAAGASATSASPGDIDLDNDSWWSLVNYRCSLHPMLCVTTSQPLLMTTSDQLRVGDSPLGACCHNTGSFSIGRSHDFSIKLSRAIPYCGLDVDMSYSFSWKEDSSTSFQAPPCGCVEMLLEQLSAVYIQDSTEQYCEPDFQQPISEPFNVRRRIRRVITTRTVPYYYQKSPPCQGCVAGSDDPDPTHLHPTGTFPATIPPELPSPWRTIRLWDPIGDGPAPGPDGTYPPPNEQMGPPRPTENSVEIDLSEQFNGRKIQSTLDLTLFEMRTVVRELETTCAGMPLVLTHDSQCRVQLGDGLELKGQIGSLVSKLRKSAKLMVGDKSYGDFNHDGTRDHSDYDALLQRVFTPGPISEARYFDLNGDGVVNSADVVVYSQLP